MEKRDVRPDSLWTRHSWLLTVTLVLVVSALGYGLDRLLVQEGLPRNAMMIFSNTLTGLFAGWLFQSFANHEKTRREVLSERMQTVAELNHHIRNALQVIKLWGGTKPALDSMQLQLINDSVERIEWALREVLPRYVPPASIGHAAMPKAHEHLNEQGGEPAAH